MSGVVIIPAAQVSNIRATMKVSWLQDMSWMGMLDPEVFACDALRWDGWHVAHLMVWTRRIGLGEREICDGDG